MLEIGTKVYLDTGTAKIKGEITEINNYRKIDSMYKVWVEDLQCFVYAGKNNLVEREK